MPRKSALRELAGHSLRAADEFARDRAELLDMMQRAAVLRARPDQPIVTPDGVPAPWMLDSLQVTLTHRGAVLAARCLLHLAAGFDATQLATYGTTGSPLLAACLMEGRGRYSGLIVRKEARAHGTRRVVEGPVDPERSVLIVDDSVSSGAAMWEGIVRLRRAGLRPEGGVALVRFSMLVDRPGGPDGGAFLRERGYRVESVFDAFADFVVPLRLGLGWSQNATKRFRVVAPARRRARSGISAPALARAAIEEYLRTGCALQAPAALARAHDAAGGVFVSVRDRRRPSVRYARDGYWNFPGEQVLSAGEGVVQAALQVAAQLPRRVLEKSGIAVTFFSELEACTVGQLDEYRHGIIVRSLDRPTVMGGALPRMPGLFGEWAHFRHAHTTNARLGRNERFAIFRHEIEKVVEPGVVWPGSDDGLTGTTDAPDPPHSSSRLGRRPPILGFAFAKGEDAKLLSGAGKGACCARKVCAEVAMTSRGAARPSDRQPASCRSIFLSVYSRGRLVGCRGAVVDSRGVDLEELARAVLGDSRLAAISVEVAFVHRVEPLGDGTVEQAGRSIRLGHHGLIARDRSGRSATLLPSVAIAYGWTAEQFAEQVRLKGELRGKEFHWSRFQAETWRAAPTGKPVELELGFPRRKNRHPRIKEFALAALNYLLRHVRRDGSIPSIYAPLHDLEYPEREPSPQLAHAAWTLARAAKILRRDDAARAARHITRRLRRALVHDGDRAFIEVEGERSSLSEVAFLLAAGMKARGLARTLWAAIDRHGCIESHRYPEPEDEIFQDYTPGQVLLALASDPRPLDEGRRKALDRALAFYRHRFRAERNLSAASWLAQAHAAWWPRVQDAPFVFELADWTLEFQQERSGGFLTGDQADAPGSTSAFYLEGIVAARRVAALAGEKAREARYRKAMQRGFLFLDRLSIRAADRVVLPEPDRALGGLRTSASSSLIRADQVQHALAAALSALSALEDA